MSNFYLENTLLVKVSAETDDLKRELSKANQSLEEFQKTAQDVSKYVNGIGTWMQTTGLALNGLETSFGWIKGVIGQFAEFGRILHKVSERTGITVTNLSALKYAAEQTGTSFDVVADAMKTFQEQLGAAQLGDQGAIDKLNAVGISHDAYQGLNGEEQFKLLADHIAQISDRAEQARTAIELFGDAGYELLPMFQRGSIGIDELCRKAKELGYTMGEEDVENAKMMTQSLNGIKNACTSLIREGIAAIAEPLINGINWLKGWVEWGSRFVSTHQGMIRMLFQTGAALMACKACLLVGPAILLGWKSLTACIYAVRVCFFLFPTSPDFV